MILLFFPRFPKLVIPFLIALKNSWKGVIGYYPLYRSIPNDYSRLRHYAFRHLLASYARGWTINVRNLSPLKDPFGVQTSRDAKVLKACSSFFHQLYCYFRKLVAGAGNYTLKFFEFLTDEEFPAGNSKSPYPCAILEFAPWIEFTPIIISVEANRRVLR